MVDNKEWHRIGDELCRIFNICSCQRKLKTIIDNLYSIYLRLEKRDFTFTGTEWLIIAMIDRNSDAITHGINCEYPILNKDNYIWKFIIESYNNPNLEDN